MTHLQISHVKIPPLVAQVTSKIVGDTKLLSSLYLQAGLSLPDISRSAHSKSFFKILLIFLINCMWSYSPSPANFGQSLILGTSMLVGWNLGWSLSVKRYFRVGINLSSPCFRRQRYSPYLAPSHFCI